MCKRYVSTAIIYAAIAMGLGVFYREFTKFMGFAGVTRLSVMHTHYFLLGMVFFLLLALLEKSFAFSQRGHTGKIVALYHVGLNIAGLGLLARGLTQVLDPQISNGLSAAISGVSGIGHILMAGGILLLLVWTRRSVSRKAA